MKQLMIAASLTLAVAAAGALAHGGEKHGDKAAVTFEKREFGTPGDPKKATRTIRIAMSDTMRYTPAEISVKAGETVRFVVKNNGKVLHEMVLGTMTDLKEHAELMRKFPAMEHNEANMLHVEPGKSGEMIWHFTEAGEFHFACLIPGHFEAGMVGKVAVQR